MMNTVTLIAPMSAMKTNEHGIQVYETLMEVLEHYKKREIGHYIYFGDDLENPEDLEVANDILTEFIARSRKERMMPDEAHALLNPGGVIGAMYARYGDRFVLVTALETPRDAVAEGDLDNTED